ncbi:MAG: spore coat protein [Treponema sp.]|jgi:spore coat polysaccharide biosynthesis protein SpsF|nr:spore coat protein [Treponema sp.]
MTAVVVQARLDSCRLEGKSLLPLGREPLVFRVMEALNVVLCDLRVLACPEDCVMVFAPFAERAGFELSVGSKDDVLSRYCAAIRRFGIDRVIRATADNPFVFADAADVLNREAVSLNADYAGYSGLPYGAGVESVNAEALLRAEREASLPSEREHVCPYLYGHPEWFQLHRPLAPREWQEPSLRVTVDTREDYERAMILYRVLSEQPQEMRYNGRNIIKTYHDIFCGKKTVRKRKLLANIA